jgi:hypothetical protein
MLSGLAASGAIAGCSQRQTADPGETATDSPVDGSTPMTISPTSELYVSPDGDDSNDGSEAAPFQTIQRARDVLREMDFSDLSDDVVVNLAPGIYEQRETLE